jgi:hypothetical protein
MHMPHGMYGGGGEGGKKESEGSPDDAEKQLTDDYTSLIKRA